MSPRLNPPHTAWTTRREAIGIGGTFFLESADCLGGEKKAPASAGAPAVQSRTAGAFAASFVNTLGLDRAPSPVNPGLVVVGVAEKGATRRSPIRTRHSRQQIDR